MIFLKKAIKKDCILLRDPQIIVNFEQFFVDLLGTCVH